MCLINKYLCYVTRQRYQQKVCEQEYKVMLDRNHNGKKKTNKILQST